MYSILIVEDDKPLAELMSVALECDKFSVRIVGTAAEGLHQVRREQPGLLLLDLALPDKSGFDLVEQLRRESRFNDLPILIHTASDLNSEEIAALTLGPVRYFKKTTIELQDLPTIVAGMLSAEC